MKKIFFALIVITLLNSCTRECWVYVDCLGNDIGKTCGSEKEVQEYCAANSTPTCKMTYRSE